MHTRLIRTHIMPNKMEQALRMFRTSIKPRLKDQRGCLGIFLLVNRETNEMATLSLWESEQAMRAAFSDDFLDQQAAKISLVAREPVIGTSYEMADSVEGYPYSLEEEVASSRVDGAN